MDSFLAKRLFLSLIQAGKAQRKAEYAGGEITYDWDLNNKQFKGTFVIPIKQVVDASNGNLIIDVEDFLQE